METNELSWPSEKFKLTLLGEDMPSHILKENSSHKTKEDPADTRKCKLYKKEKEKDMTPNSISLTEILIKTAHRIVDTRDEVN